MTVISLHKVGCQIVLNVNSRPQTLDARTTQIGRADFQFRPQRNRIPSSMVTVLVHVRNHTFSSLMNLPLRQHPVSSNRPDCPLAGIGGVENYCSGRKTVGAWDRITLCDIKCFTAIGYSNLSTSPVRLMGQYRPVCGRKRTILLVGALDLVDMVIRIERLAVLHAETIDRRAPVQLAVWIIGFGL